MRAMHKGVFRAYATTPHDVQVYQLRPPFHKVPSGSDSGVLVAETLLVGGDLQQLVSSP